MNVPPVEATNSSRAVGKPSLNRSASASGQIVPVLNLDEEQSCRHWDCALIEKYNVAGPRYTSYPTAPQFTEAYTPEVYRQEAQEFLASSIAPLSLYIHIPFCHNICYYCGCNKIVTSDHSVARTYLDYLHKEIELQAPLVGRHRPVTQLHFGGGTPTFLDGAELTELMHLLASHYNLIDAEHREYSIEIDPRTVTRNCLALLKGLGFNRISLGVQDFDERVQKAINRIQDVSMIKVLTDTARLYQFKSVSYDLIYGLPFQSADSLADTLSKVIDLSPDRIAFYNYAHLPERFKSQRAIDRLDLPSAREKINMLALIADTLQAAGYVHIGMDHFVKPDDELAIAQKEGRLQRNFQGYSTCLAQDLVGLGVSSISSLRQSYAQNEKDLETYYQLLDEGELPIVKGLQLNTDDLIRRRVISELICNMSLSVQDIEATFDICFSDYFAQELISLQPLEKDGLLAWQDDRLTVLECGRPMLRNICMVFDTYFQRGEAARYSKTL